MRPTRLAPAVCSLVACLALAASAPPAAMCPASTFSLTYDLDSSFSVDQRSLDEAQVGYAVCNGNETRRDCEVARYVLETEPQWRRCNVTLSASSGEASIFKKVRVALLAGDRAVLLSREGPKLRLTNVAFADCSTREATIVVSEDVDDERGIKVMAYEDGYDVFHTNRDKCGMRSCRTGFDNEGKLAREPTAWGPEFEEPYKYVDVLQSVQRRSPAKGFVAEVFEIYDKVYEILVNEDGEKEIARSDKVDDVHAISTHGGHIGICTFSWTDSETPGKIVHTLACNRTDLEGKFARTEMRANASSVIGESRNVDLMARLNQPDGFVLFTVEYSEEVPYNRSQRAYRFNGSGEKVKSAEVPDFGCGTKMQPFAMRAYQNAAGQPCVTFACENISKVKEEVGAFGDLAVVKKCFSEAEL